MNKLLTKIVGAVLGASMAVGVGVGVAINNDRKEINSEVTAADQTATLSITSSVTSNTTLTDNNDKDWSLTCVCSGWTANNSYIHIGSNSKAATSITLESDDYSDVLIKEVHVWAAAKANSNVTTKISIDGNLLGTSSVLGNTASSGGTEFSVDNDDEYSGTISVVISRPSSSSAAIYFNKLTVVYAAASSKTSTETTISAAGSKTTLDITASPADSVLLTPTISYSGGTITSSVSWESSNTSVATVSAASGTTTTVTAVGKGETTITASYDGDDTYDSSSGTITIRVINPNEKTYSLAFADGLITDSGTWSTSYAEHKGYTKTETGIGTLTFNFAAASKQSATITDYPVGKNGDVEMILSSSSHYIKDVTFNGVQWAAKNQTMNIYYSTNGGTSYTSASASSSSFTVTKTGLTVGTNAIKITFDNSSNQIGHKSFEVLYAERPASGHSITFNKNTEDQVDDMPSTLTNQSGTVSLEEYVPSRSGYTFSGWSLSSSGETVSSVTITDSDIEVFAIWAVAPTPVATAKRCYTLVTSTDGLVAGAKYIIANDADAENGFFAIGEQKTSNRDAEPITSQKTGVAQVSSSAVEIITLGGSTGAWTLGVDGGYLYAASSTANQLKTRETNSDGNSQWAISFTNGVASIVAQGGTNRSVMQYNYNGGADKALFACYETAKQDDVYLYRLDFEETLLGNITCDGSGSHTLPTGYTWNDDLQGVYNDLPVAEKSSLVTKSAGAGSGLERYDYIIGKYNHEGSTNPEDTDYVHFITGRTIINVNSSRILLNGIFSDNGSAATIIIVISVLTLTTLGGYFLLRKRKEEN